MVKEKTGLLLVVDDEIETLTPLCDLLSEWGYEVTKCTSGKEALEAFKNKTFDVLLADLVMPEMDGITLIKEAIKTDPLLVSIIITGHGTIETAVEAMKIGAFDYVIKPMEWKILKPIITRAIKVHNLRKSEERHRVIIEDLTDFIRCFLPDGTLTFMNEAYCQYFGKKREELIGQSFISLIPDKDREFVQRQFTSLTIENPFITYEHRVIKPDEEIAWQQWTDRAIFNDRGELIEYQSIGRDITEHKEMEKSLKKEQFKLREYFENFPVPAYTVTFDGKIADCNNVAVSTLDYDNKDELIGKPVISTIYAPSSQEKAKQLFEKLKRWGKLKNEELQIITKQGEIKDVLLNVDTIYDHKGTPLYSISTQLDITERKQKDKELLRREKEIRTIADNVPAAISYVDSDGFYRFVNKRYEEWFELSQNEILGMHYRQLLGDATYYLIKEHVEAALSGKRVHYETALPYARGGTRWVMVDYVPDVDAMEKVNGFFAMLNDITERKKAEAQLQFLSSMVEQSLDSIITTDTDFCITYMNKSAEKLFGWSLDELRGKTPDIFNAEPDSDKMQKHIYMTLSSGDSYSSEALNRRKDGSTFYCQFRVSPLINKDGEIYGYMGSQRDVTDRAKAIEKLQKSEARYRDLYDNAPDMYHTLNENGIIVDCNETESKMLGYNKEEIIGKHITEFFTEESKILYETDFPLLKDKKRLSDLEREFIRKDGTTFPAILNVFSEYNKNGKFIGTKTIARDITVLKKAENMLKAERNRLYNVLEAMPIMVCLLTPDYHVAFANQAFRAKFGESHGRHCYEYCFGKKEPCDFCETYRVLKTGKPHHWQLTIRDSSIIDIYDFPFTDVDGSPMILEMDIDITEHKQAEDALRESENRLMSIFRTAPIGIGVVSSSDRIIMDVNDEICKMLGYYESELLGETARMLYTSEKEYRNVNKALSDQRKEYGVGRVETQWKRKDGRIIDIILSSSHIDRRDPSKGITFTVINITEQKSAEKALKASEEKYRLLVENQSDMVVKVDTDGRFLYVSPTYCKTFGKTEKKLLGKKFMPLVHEEDRESTDKAMENLYKPPYTCYIEQRALTKNGWRWLAWSDKAILDKQKKVIEIVGAGRDVTERKQFEEQLEISNKQLRALASRISEIEETERRRLARELHDQVGQNLTALGINLNTLPTLVSPVEEKKIKKRVQDTQKLLDETTRSIRSVMSDLRPSVLDDYGLFAAFRWYSQRFSERTGIPVKISGKELKSRLSGFLETTLYRIIQEALTNVLKHANASKVNVHVGEAKSSVKLTITDNGKGFDPSTVLKRKKQKVWGLLTMKERTEAIGGKFNIQSSPGKGTKIVVEIKR